MKNTSKRSRHGRSPKRTAPIVQEYSFPSHLIDQDALSVVRRLQSFGYLAYFVGGCVRDALLGTSPKDFDIVTSARPREVRAIFRNAQLIGRRFKLAHLRFKGDKILEVATFRQPPATDSIQDGVIVEDNEYGTPETDAYRRDFTINALFYDPIQRELIDYTGGLKDIEQKIIRSIGDPLVRFREDPIRMLRAVKFAARLDLEFDELVKQAIKSERPSLAEAARPRLQQELVRYLQRGAADRSFELLVEYDLLRPMSPELCAWLSLNPSNSDELSALLSSHDRHTSNNWPRGPREERILAVIFWPWINALLSGHGSLSIDDETTHKILPLKQRDLKTAIVRLLAPTATRIGMSIKTLHAVSRIICSLTLHGWAIAGIMEKGKTTKIKGEVTFETLSLLKARFHAGLTVEEEWSSMKSLWEICLEERAHESAGAGSKRRQLIPKKPVIKPTKKRPRRSKLS